MKRKDKLKLWATCQASGVLGLILVVAHFSAKWARHGGGWLAWGCFSVALLVALLVMIIMYDFCEYMDNTWKDDEPCE